MKKIWSKVCMAAFVFCLSMLPSEKASAQVSEDAVTSGQWIYEERSDYETGAAFADLVGTTASGATLEIPEMIDNLPVKYIGWYEPLEAANAAGFQKVVIPDSVEVINDDAFKGFTGIKELVLPDNQQLDICGGAFSDAAALESITVAREQDLYDSSFSPWNKNVNVKTITIKGNTESIDLEYVADIFKKAETINLADSVKVLAAPDFSGLSRINGKDISGVKFGSLKNCASLHIAVNADLTSGGMPDYSNSGITRLTLEGARLTNIHNEYLKNCASLQAIEIQGENEYYLTKDGVLYSKYMDSISLALEVYPMAKSAPGDYTFDANVISVLTGAFDGCRCTSFTIPENVTSWIWDYNYRESADGQMYKTGTFLTTTGAKLRLVQGSFADEGSIGKIAESAMVPESQIEYYLGNTYQISYNLAGGVNAPGNPSSYRAGEILTLANPTYSGYTFLGWVRSDGPGYENTTRMKDCFQNYTFTATWIHKQTGAVVDPTEKQTTYVLKYYANGGKGTMADAKCSYNAPFATAGNKFVRKGYTFRGWSVRNSGGAWLAKGGWQGVFANRMILSNKSALNLDASAGNTVTLYAEWTKVQKPAAVKKVKLSNKKAKKMNVSFGKVKGASGYEIQYATSKKFKGKKSVLTSGAKKTVSKLKKRNTYYVRVRAYKKDSTGAKVWGKYSKTARIKIKK